MYTKDLSKQYPSTYAENLEDNDKNDGRQPISRFFQQFDVYDLMPYSTRVVTMNWNLSLYRAFRVMGENNITNLFGWCPITRRYMCVLTSSDIMRVTLALHKVFFDERNPKRIDPEKFLIANERQCIIEALKGRKPNILTLLNTISIKEWKLRPRLFDGAGYDDSDCISKSVFSSEMYDSPSNSGTNSIPVSASLSANSNHDDSTYQKIENKKSPASLNATKTKNPISGYTEKDIEASRVPRFLYGFPDTTLYTAIRFLFKNKIHRFPILAKDGSITHSITYRSICRFLVSNFRFEAEILSTPLLTDNTNDKIGDVNPVTIEMTTTLCDAVELLLKHNLSVIPVMKKNPENGRLELYDVFSKYDYISLSKMHDLDTLDRTIGDVIAERPRGVEGLFLLPHDATIGRVLKEIAQNDLHRIILVDKNDRKILKAVVSLRHILVFLVADRTTERIISNELEENKRKQEMDNNSKEPAIEAITDTPIPDVSDDNENTESDDIN